MTQTPEVPPVHVSVVHEFPEDLYDAMRAFVRSHPNWDQYRLMQVALAGFLFQQGSRERAVARHYLDGLFDRGGTVAAPARPSPVGREVVETPPPPPPGTPRQPSQGSSSVAGAPLRRHAPPAAHHPPVAARPERAKADAPAPAARTATAATGAARPAEAAASSEGGPAYRRSS